MTNPITRRNLLGFGVAAPALVFGSVRLTDPNVRRSILATGEKLSYTARNLIRRDALAREYALSEISPVFRINGNSLPNFPRWKEHYKQDFETWRLHVRGAVENPQSFSLADLKALPSRSQITRHDCVEGWSAIAQWKGAQLGPILEAVQLKANARYVFFLCADDFKGVHYYESIDLLDAFHPQTILAHEMNGAPLKVAHGAPIRLRVERQLGYKQAKFIFAIHVVSSLSEFGNGKGGYWEDYGGYEWFAGI
jgi:DMSO/TMAO reductase YedYZ molybdopterin-dependent catalytic subunit